MTKKKSPSKNTTKEISSDIILKNKREPKKVDQTPRDPQGRKPLQAQEDSAETSSTVHRRSGHARAVASVQPRDWNVDRAVAIAAHRDAGQSSRTIAVQAAQETTELASLSAIKERRKGGREDNDEVDSQDSNIILDLDNQTRDGTGITAIETLIKEMDLDPHKSIAKRTRSSQKAKYNTNEEELEEDSGIDSSNQSRDRTGSPATSITVSSNHDSLDTIARRGSARLARVEDVKEDQDSGIHSDSSLLKPTEDDVEPKKSLGVHFPGKVYMKMKKLKKKEASLPVKHSHFHKMISMLETGTKSDEEDRMEQSESEDPSMLEKEFIVGATKTRRNGLNMVLAKFEKIATPRWIIVHSLDDVHLARFRLRMKWEDELTRQLINECRREKKSFKAVYPGRYLARPSGDEMAMLQAMIRARELDICERNEAAGLPPVLFIHWLDEQLDVKTNSLFDFEYTNELHPSAKVMKMVKMRHWTLKCDKKCSCSVSPNSPAGDCKCDFDKTLSFSMAECCNSCGCSISCPNRVVQRGRQKPLVSVTHPQKGWTMRSPEGFKKGELISEYAGELLTYAENLKRGDDTYSIEASCCFESLTRKRERQKEKHHSRTRERWMTKYCHRRFVINGRRKGNEGRNFAHSCRPNSEMREVYIERYGYGFNRFALFAKCDIAPWEELCWNYLGDRLTKAQLRGKKIKSNILPECSCGWPECAIEPSSAASEEEKEDSEDSCDEYDKKAVARKKKAARKAASSTSKKTGSAKESKKGRD